MRTVYRVASDEFIADIYHDGFSYHTHDGVTTVFTPKLRAFLAANAIPAEGAGATLQIACHALGGLGIFSFSAQLLGTAIRVASTQCTNVVFEAGEEFHEDDVQLFDLYAECQQVSGSPPGRKGKDCDVLVLDLRCDKPTDNEA